MSWLVLGAAAATGADGVEAGTALGAEGVVTTPNAAKSPVAPLAETLACQTLRLHVAVHEKPTNYFVAEADTWFCVMKTCV